MDGDLAPIPELVRLRSKYRFLLMVDEAHSFGVVGARGFGVRDHFDLDPTAIDIWMGTLSKSLAGCGGYIAGSRALIDILRYRAGGSVYSVGMPPPVAAASLAALAIMEREPERVATLHARTRHLIATARAKGLDTGRAEGFAIVPIILGSSSKAVRLSNRLFERGISASPATPPGVEEKASRLRLFLNCTHSEDQIETLVKALVECMPWI